jgi:DHA2 family multidrug resistance protein
LLLAALAIGLGNFLVVLDTTIANVSVPTIAGALGVSSTEGTWVITSYAVAEAITVPLTGWLSRKFGTTRVFLTCYFGFALLSMLCGMSSSLGMLIGCRVLLGLCGGPIMPLSQTLLLRILPPEKQTLGTIMWAMTTLIGPVVGPVLGGYLCDNAGWSWIFFISVPVAIPGGMLLAYLMRGQPDPTGRARLDGVGLALLIVWVGSLQILLDEGRNRDWFADPMIQILGVVAAIGFAAFMIWELTEKEPIVDLKVFRHPGFTAATLTYSVGFAAFFANIVIMPLWLQQNMGYTATWAGLATGMMGLLAILSAPPVGIAAEKLDPRAIVFVGLLGLGAISLWRMTFNSDVTFAQMAWPTLLTGPFMVMFFVPTIGLAMSSVSPGEEANAAGLSNFLRTLAGAFATSLVQTHWEDATRRNQTELAGAMTHANQSIDSLTATGMSHGGAMNTVVQALSGQSVMLATLNVFAIIAVGFVLAGCLIWIAPRPKGPIDLSGGH